MALHVAEYCTHYDAYSKNRNDQRRSFKSLHDFLLEILVKSFGMMLMNRLRDAKACQGANEAAHDTQRFGHFNDLC